MLVMTRRDLFRAGSVAAAGAALAGGAVAGASGAGAAGLAPSAATSAAAVSSGLRVGSRGPKVVALQNRLNALGYYAGRADGVYAGQTRQAVLAVQKVAGLSRVGSVGTGTASALNRGVRPKARSTSGHVIEIDKARQVLLVVDGGRVARIYNCSSGNGHYYYDRGRRARAVTPSGTFRFYWQVANGWQHGRLGDMYRPMYFNGGVAVHGSRFDVGAWPSSHGCVRVYNGTMDELRRGRAIYLGGTVRVY